MTSVAKVGDKLQVLDVECPHPSGGGCFVWAKVKLKNG